MYPIEQTLYAPYMMSNFDKELIQMVLDQLYPSNVQYVFYLLPTIVIRKNPCERTFYELHLSVTYIICTQTHQLLMQGGRKHSKVAGTAAKRGHIFIDFVILWIIKHSLATVSEFLLSMHCLCKLCPFKT